MAGQRTAGSVQRAGLLSQDPRDRVDNQGALVSPRGGKTLEEKSPVGHDTGLGVTSVGTNWRTPSGWGATCWCHEGPTGMLGAKEEEDPRLPRLKQCRTRGTVEASTSSMTWVAHVRHSRCFLSLRENNQHQRQHKFGEQTGFLAGGEDSGSRDSCLLRISVSRAHEHVGVMSAGVSALRASTLDQAGLAGTPQARRE